VPFYLAVTRKFYLTHVVSGTFLTLKALLKSPPDRKKAQHSIKYIVDVDQNINILDEDELSDGFNHVEKMCKEIVNGIQM
jgi:hypothetical protein